MAFNGYYMKIGNVTFNNPSPLRETFKFAPALVQVGDSYVLASGKLHTKVLPHTRAKIWCEFPPMTEAQYRTYWNALHSDEGGSGMFLTIEVYDQSTDSYVTDTFYHTDIMATPITYGGQRMVKMDPLELIGH